MDQQRLKIFADALSAWVPFFQTTLWVGLIAWVIKRYHEHLVNIISEIRDRIKTGSSFELINGLKVGPAPSLARRKKTEVEIAEIMKDLQSVSSTIKTGKSKNTVLEPKGSSNSTVTPITEVDQGNAAPTPTRTAILRRYREVEDLALRKLRETHGVSLKTEVILDNDPQLQFDGIYTEGDASYFVEIKYIATQRLPYGYIDRLNTIIPRLVKRSQGKSIFQLILVYESPALVTEHDIDQFTKRLNKEFGDRVVVEVLYMTELSAEFQ